jgi:hypothetical protein
MNTSSWHGTWLSTGATSSLPLSQNSFTEHQLCIEALVKLVQVNLPLCFNRGLQHEGVLVEWSASRPGRFIPRERAAGTRWIGGCVGSRAGLNAVVKRKIPSPYRDSNPPIIQPVSQPYTTELLL